MKKGLTEMVFILDRSGSMSGLESDTIGGFNSMIEKQKKEEGEAYVSTVMFNDYSKVVHDRISIKDVEALTEKDYQVGGCTALIDALGDAIHHIGNIHKYAREEDIPEHTIFAITTDGEENASHKYSSNDIKKLIENQKQKYGWEFIFVAANIDAVETAAEYGIDAHHAVNYIHDRVGTAMNMKSMDMAICSIRKLGKLDDAWKEEVENDFKTRSKDTKDKTIKTTTTKMK